MDFWVWWLILAVIIGAFATWRGRSGLGWFLLAAIISPLLAGLLLALLPQLIDATTTTAIGAASPSTHVKCPDCAELVLKEARVCKHCGCRLVPQPDLA